MSIHVIVIGAGLAGLAAAISIKVADPEHQVTVFEAVQKLDEIGAGLQLTPNATRLFQRWGIYDNLSVQATSHKSLTVRRFDGTKILAHEPYFQDKILSRYQAPFWGMHRVDLQRTLVARCEDIGVQIHYHSRVVFVDFDSAEVEIESTGGKKVKGDVVICADGIWSVTRSQFLANSRPAKPTGDLAYRIVIDVSDLSGPDAPELRKFIQDEGTNFWIGPGSHVVAYAMRATTVYNIVLLCPDDLPEGITKIGGNLLEMQKLFEQWDPLLQKFLNQVKSTAKWRLTYLDANEVPEWANAKGTFIMAGDSCHAMLPYLAQGANTSLEDGAVLGYLLGKVSFNIAPLETFVHRLVANIANYQSNLTASARGYSEGLTGSNLPRLQVLLSRLTQLEHGTDSSSHGLGESTFKYPAVPSATVLGNLTHLIYHQPIRPIYKTALERQALQHSQIIPRPPWMEMPPWPRSEI